MSAVGLVQRRLGVGQAQAGNAVKVMIQRFDWSRADLANCSHYELELEVEDSDVIVAGNYH